MKRQLDARNNVTTTFDYDDFGRPVSQSEAGMRSFTRAYKDGMRAIVTGRDLDANRKIAGVTQRGEGRGDGMAGG